MNYKKGFFGMVVCLLPVIVQSYEIEFSRSYNKVMTANNQLSITLKSDGSGHIEFPDFYKHNGQVKLKESVNKVSQFDRFIGSLRSQNKQSSLKTKMAAIENYHNLPLFYSSDVDLFTLKVTEDGNTLLDVSFNNWEELNHRYEYMGEWQTMIDLVNTIQKVSVDAHNKMIQENEQ